MIVATPSLAPPVVPVEIALATLRRFRGAEGSQGVAPGLLVRDPGAQWAPASGLITERDGDDGDDTPLDHLVAAAHRRWRASPHVAASLAWRSYTYWLAMPVVLGWATARRVLRVEPDDVLVRVADQPPAPGDPPLVTVGLRRLRVAVLPDDPLAAAAGTGAEAEVEVVGSEAELLEVLRETLRDRHLEPLLARLRDRFRLGSRTLRGSLASAVAYAVVRGLDVPPHDLHRTAETLLTTLGVDDLVELVGGPDGPQVQRRTCCLAFTLPEPKVCSGCCLRAD